MSNHIVFDTEHGSALLEEFLELGFIEGVGLLFSELMTGYLYLVMTPLNTKEPGNVAKRKEVYSQMYVAAEIIGLLFGRGLPEKEGWTEGVPVELKDWMAKNRPFASMENPMWVRIYGERALSGSHREADRFAKLALQFMAPVVEGSRFMGREYHWHLGDICFMFGLKEWN